VGRGGVRAFPVPGGGRERLVELALQPVGPLAGACGLLLQLAERLFHGADRVLGPVPFAGHGGERGRSGGGCLLGAGGQLGQGALVASGFVLGGQRAGAGVGQFLLESAELFAQPVGGLAAGAGVLLGLLGKSFFAKGAAYPGLGIMDFTSDRGETRAVGELAGDIDPALGLPPLTGFENHGGRTHLGPGVKPLIPRISAGIGNDGQHEGVWQERIIGTYSHGPALARNPAIADLLLSWASGQRLEPIDDALPNRLRHERLAAVAR
jgi:hypothetical protein